MTVRFITPIFFVLQEELHPPGRPFVSSYSVTQALVACNHLTLCLPVSFVVNSRSCLNHLFGTINLVLKQASFHFIGQDQVCEFIRLSHNAIV
jgi:hypothetical protein